MTEKIHKLTKPLAAITITLTAVLGFISTTAIKAQDPSTTPGVIYDNMLASKWQDWSWNSTVNYASTNRPLFGSNALEWITSNWGGLYLHTDVALEPSNFESLQFSLRAFNDGQSYILFMYDENNKPIPQTVALQDYGGNPQAGVWKTYTIPMQVSNPAGLKIKGVALQETTGRAQNKVYVDEMKFIPKVSTQPVNATTVQPIFSDSLVPGVENWSWSSNISFDISSPTYKGIRSIAFTPHSGWGGLYLSTKTPIDTTPLQNIQFAVFATEANQKFSVLLKNDQNDMTSSPLPLEKYGAIPQGSWKLYSIPLADLNAKDKRISGIVIQEIKGTGQSTIYIDEIAFTGADGVRTITTAPIPSLSSTPSPTPTLVVNTPSPIPSGTPVTQIQSTNGNPFASAKFYIPESNNAKKTTEQWRAAGRNVDADQMMKIANNPWAMWAVGGDAYNPVNDYVTKASVANALPVIVAYNIPGRDCGQYSQGGATYDGYKSWISSMANAIGDRKAVVILEPDALGLDCLQNESTYSLMRYAIETLEAKSQTAVYVEASSWVSPDTMANRLNSVGVNKAEGFSINVSGYNKTDGMVAYGNSISSKIGGKHFVIDTSRNGNGPYDQSQNEAWCNPPDRALGNQPTSNTGHATVDAYFWLKPPGESDGTCRGGPSAGQWWPEYALGLAQRAAF